jgi:uncharacterized protein with HEPN domain
LFIDDIKKAISKVELYTEGLTFAEFEKDSKTVDAVIRNLEIIGEAVKNLSSEMIEKYPSVDWSGATTMRDRLIHGYFGVDVSIVWETITSDLPKLKKQVEKIWQELD